MNKSVTSAPSHVSLHRTGPSLIGVLLNALDIWRERRVLEGLEPHMLRDLGLTRTDVERETKRPVWDAPNRWLR
ncbi:MAG: DUF1127 domain-containing protein [Pseudomonadota bacterium]